MAIRPLRTTLQSRRCASAAVAPARFVATPNATVTQTNIESSEAVRVAGSFAAKNRTIQGMIAEK